MATLSADPPTTRARRHAFSVGIAAAAKRITVRFVHVPGCQRGKKKTNTKRKREKMRRERKKERGLGTDGSEKIKISLNRGSCSGARCAL